MPYYHVSVEHTTLILNQFYTYYCNKPVKPGVRVQVPFGKSMLTGLVIEEVDRPENCFFTIKEISRIIDDEPVLDQEMIELAEYLSNRCICSFMSVVKIMLPPSFQVQSDRKKEVYDYFLQTDPASLQSFIEKGGKLTERQKEVLEALKEQKPAAKARKEYSASIISALFKKGLIVQSRKPRTYAYEDTVIQEAPELSISQKQACKQIIDSENPLILLHGVTGAGKTEVFFELAQKALSNEQSVLFLVPEIGLTPMMIARIQSRFQEPVIVYHSRLNAAQKADQYRKVKSGRPVIVIGTRSAVFLPFKKIGLIIMDEEHDSSYKQESMPRYHVRDAAIFRARWHKCKLIMASATPALESFARAGKGVYQLVSLPERIKGKLPSIRIINMKNERSYGGLSAPLIAAIQKRLDLHEQVILLLNRRGYTPVASCTVCKEALLCEDCGIPLSYHKAEGVFMCHICSKTYPLNSECPVCHSHQWSDLGAGTQKLEEKLAQLFPDARILRMDADSTRKKQAHEKILKEFEQSGDILLGTQMISKGLDFERVTLSAIVNADAALSRSDYRAAEMTYQMLEQTSGRAGRGKLPGQVIIQTYNPDHYVMKAITAHSYSRFYALEMNYRHIGFYPPYTYLAVLIFFHEDLDEAMKAAEKAREYLESEEMPVFGPLEISMRKKIKRTRLLIKSKNEEKLISLLWNYVSWHQKNQPKIRVDVNLNPMMLEE